MGQEMRTGPRKPNGVMTRLGSRITNNYPSQRLWSQVVPRKPMIQKIGKVAKAKGSGFRNSLLELTAGSQPGFFVPSLLRKLLKSRGVQK